MHAFLTANIAPPPPHPDVIVLTPNPSIGIESIRELTSFLNSKPILSKHKIAYLIDAHLLTIPAQNALLKTLEEPPGNSHLFLITSQPFRLLPTILSRVQIVSTPVVSPLNEIDQANFDKFTTSDIASRFKLLETLNYDRSQWLNWLNSFELYIHSHLDLWSYYYVVSQAKKYLVANVTTKLVLDYLVLNLP